MIRNITLRTNIYLSLSIPIKWGGSGTNSLCNIIPPSQYSSTLSCPLCSSEMCTSLLIKSLTTYTLHTMVPIYSILIHIMLLMHSIPNYSPNIFMQNILYSSYFSPCLSISFMVYLSLYFYCTIRYILHQP